MIFLRSNLFGIPVSAIQAIVVLVPTYTMAYVTDKMVWTIPMLAAMSFVAARIGKAHEEVSKRTDDQDG